MKRAFIATVLAAICCCNINAQETTTPAAPAAAVPARLQEVTYITDTKPAADAQFYVYLSSASWCGPCRAIMPKVVEQYPAIKAAGGEIILLCCDPTPQLGANYVKKYNAEFPSVLYNLRYSKLELPGLTPPRSIPNVVIVNAEGKVLHNGHGATLLNWQSIIAK